MSAQSISTYNTILPNAIASTTPSTLPLGKAITGLLLSLGLCLSSCGSDTPTQTNTPTSESDATALVQTLDVTFQQGIVAAQAGEGSLSGISGELRVVGMQWRFDHYSTVNGVFIDGELIVDAAQKPMVMRGELELSGALTGVLFVDLSYNSSNGVFDGVISVDGIPIAMSERLCCVN